MAERDRPLLAVLIDADNVPAKHAEAILKEIAGIGEPALRRVYGDWSSEQLSGWTKHIRTLGLVAHQQTANTKGKNASDIGLVIDAMDILHGRRFDGFVLVSSDSDFTALANRMREDGLMVVGIGEKKTPEALRNVCNRFIFIENITSEPETRQIASDARQLNEAFRLIADTMDKIDQEGDWFNLGRIGGALMAAHPDFDTRSYGHGKLSALVKAMPRLESRQEGNILMVRRKD
ncbi:NYN domain-containing protein [Sulfitobacter sp. LCG007]